LRTNPSEDSGDKQMKIKKSGAYALHALMYMVRHNTQLPATTATIAKAEGIPSEYLAKIFRQLVKAHFIKAVKNKSKGYVFARPPEEISLLELFEAVEGSPLFEDCFLRHCECGGTKENCRIYSVWSTSTNRVRQILEDTTIANAAWSHPEHRFMSLPESLAKTKGRKKAKSELPGTASP
jgi:Rrf2 family iron-sulfur cluster assembly transcriptional regulator